MLSILVAPGLPLWRALPQMCRWHPHHSLSPKQREEDQREVCVVEAESEKAKRLVQPCPAAPTLCPTVSPTVFPCPPTPSPQAKIKMSIHWPQCLPTVGSKRSYFWQKYVTGVVCAWLCPHSFKCDKCCLFSLANLVRSQLKFSIVSGKSGKK